MKNLEFLEGITVRQFIKLFKFPIMILLIHSFFAYLDLYRTIFWIDIPMHFLGGMALGYSLSLFLRIIQNNGHLGKTHEIIFFGLVVSLVALAAVTWELLEFSLDLIDNAMRQPSLANTMKDLFLGISGGMIGYSINRMRNLINNKTR